MTSRARVLAGRINFLLLGGIVAVALFAFIFLMGRESVETVAARFMTALSTGDIDTLTANSYLGSKSKDEIKKQWEFTVKDISKHYLFHWRITGSQQADEKTAAVKLSFMKNVDSESTYEENFALPLVNVDGKWLVDVRGISRDMYPALPR